MIPRDAAPARLRARGQTHPGPGSQACSAELDPDPGRLSEALTDRGALGRTWPGVLWCAGARERLVGGLRGHAVERVGSAVVVLGDVGVGALAEFHLRHVVGVLVDRHDQPDDGYEAAVNAGEALTRDEAIALGLSIATH